MVAVGLTVLVAPVVPSFQLTVPAQLDTVKVAEFPVQTVGLLTLGVGCGVTVTVPVAVPVPEQFPVETLQVAVYEVVDDGLTVLVKPVVPSFQLTVPAQLETVKTALLPEHIVGLLTLGDGVGFGVTVTVPVAVPVPVQFPIVTLHVAV